LREIIIESPITGTVLEVAVSAGEQVGPGDVLVVVESMKMENEVFCEHDGQVVSVGVVEGQSVAEDEALLTIAVS
jgi:biotin carboxyl carrier protein